MDLQFPPGGSQIIRVTERSSFRRCRRQWYYAYRMRLQPRDASPDARSFGTAIHSCLAAYYKSLRTIDDLDEAEAQSLIQWAKVRPALDPEQQELGDGMLCGYFKFAEKEDEDHKPVVVEQTMFAKIPGTRVWLQGTMDLVMENYRGLWIFDHKTFTTLLTEEQTEFDDQLVAYIWLCRQNGINVRGGVYNMLRKKVPRVPPLLKSGELSRNKQMDTTRQIYRQAVLDNGLRLEAYMDFISELPEEKDFFKRIQVVKSQRTIQSFEENLIHEARDMYGKSVPMYPNHSKECAYCDFRNLCRTQTDKGDMAYMIKQLYTVQPIETPIRRES